MKLEAKLKAEIARLRKRQAFALECGYARAAEKNAAKATYHAGLLGSLKSGADPSDIEFKFDPDAQLNRRREQMEDAACRILDKYVAAMPAGSYNLTVHLSARHFANFDIYTVNGCAKYTFANLKDAILAARYAKANVADFNFAEIDAAHFPDVLGYFINETVEQAYMGNAEVRAALDELNDRAAEIAKVFGAENAELYRLAGLYDRAAEEG